MSDPLAKPGESRPISKYSNNVILAAKGVKYEHLLAGISGGVVSTLVLHPLDLLKIRFAVDDGKVKNRPHYDGLRHAFRVIFRQEGIGGLYKGVTPNITGAGTAWGFYFLFYNTIKTSMQDGNSKTQLTPAKHMMAAAYAGVVTLAMTNPIWVVKTRLVLQYGGTPLPGEVTYRGMFDCLTKIAKTEGIRGLYKGFVPGLFGVSHGAIQFMVYEEMKTTYNHHKMQPIDTKLGSHEYLLFAAISKLVAAVTTYPYQVLRARLQDHHSDYTGTLDCFQKTLRYEGLPGFYKGLSPYLFHVLPNICLVFLIYEKMSGNGLS